jgi:hypothetical protein
VAVALVLVVTRPWSSDSGTGGVAASPGTSLPSLSPVPAGPVPGVLSGVYCGGTSASCVQSFEAFRGTPVGIVGTFLPKTTWTDIEVPPWWPAIWRGTAYANKLVVSVPMLPDQGGATLQAGARGDYDEHFKATARNLVAAGFGNAWIRPGHELNGTWYRWSAQQDPQAYAQYFRRIVLAMRSVPGQSFHFDWNVAVGGDLHMDATLAYPGDGFVDVIGEDVYDQKWQDPSATPDSRWASLVDPVGATAQGLEFWATFAKAHGKRLSFAEWGVVAKGASMSGGGAGGDDPAFIDHMHQWFGDHDVAYEIYFNQDAGDGAHRLDAGRFPLSAARYVALF